MEEGAYGYTRRWYESYIDLLFLRARWYASGAGIFISKDAWEGDIRRSQSMNGWSYAEGNPVLYTDPSGHCVLAPPYDTALCITLLAIALSSCGSPNIPIELNVTVDFTVLEGSIYNPEPTQQFDPNAEFANEAEIQERISEYVTHMNQVFDQADIRVNQGGVKILTHEQTTPLLGDFSDTETRYKLMEIPTSARLVPPPTDPAIATLLTAYPPRAGAVMAYIVPSRASDARGTALLESHGAPGPAFIYNTFQGDMYYRGKYMGEKHLRTLSHELAHVLGLNLDTLPQGQGEHPEDTANLMSVGGDATNGTKLAGWQIEIIRKSQYLKPVIPK